MKKISFFVIACLIYGPVNADIYKIFWPEENMADPENNPEDTSWQSIKITNISSNTVIDGSLSGVYNQDVSELISGASIRNNGDSYQLERSLTATGSGPTVLDFTGNTIKFRAESGIALNPQGSSGATYTYDVVYEINPETGAISSTTLIASSDAEAELADAAGFNVDTEISEVDRSGQPSSFQSYAVNVSNEGTVNVETAGGLVAEQLSNPDGTSLLRKEDDGTVHIGRNSIVLADEAVSASGNDEVYSSSGKLQLGNNASHKTIIKGTLEVPKPKTGNEAANKSYVDGVGAMVMAAAQLNMMYNPDSVLDLGFGLGSMDNENAIAVGLGGVLPDSNMRYSLSATYSDYTAQVSYGAGLSFSLE